MDTKAAHRIVGQLTRLAGSRSLHRVYLPKPAQDPTYRSSAHIEAGPIKADFDRAASKVEANLGEAGIPVPAHAEASSLTDLAAQEPEMVIAEAFRLVEQELRDAP